MTMSQYQNGPAGRGLPKIVSSFAAPQRVFYRTLPLPRTILLNFTATQSDFTEFYRSPTRFYRTLPFLKTILARFQNFGRVCDLKISARRVPRIYPALKTRGIAPGDANNAIAHVFGTAGCSEKSDKNPNLRWPQYLRISEQERAQISGYFFNSFM